MIPSANSSNAPANAPDNFARVQRIARGAECPDCGSTDTESNGGTEYRCCRCDHRWGREGGSSGEPYGY